MSQEKTDSKTPAKVGGVARAPRMPGSKRGFKGFYNDVNREVKKVSWPTTHETNRLTGVVLAVCGLIVLVLLILSELSDIVVKIITTGKGGG